MKQILLLVTVFTIFSCVKEKVLQLPEISHSEITNIKDVSHAYLFYDETQKDSVELNRKNLISTTNWLINVDKRLTLKQAIPHIKYLQEKKSSSSHKNRNAKNYFTCNDTSRKNLGFIEFTDVIYHLDSNQSKIIALVIPKEPILLLELNTKDNLLVNDLYANKIKALDTIKLSEITYSKLNRYITKGYYGKIMVSCETDLLFQDYIKMKSILSKLDSSKVRVSNNEFIY